MFHGGIFLIEERGGRGIAFLKEIARFSVAPFVNFFLGIVAVVFLTRIFPPEVYGAWNLFNLAANVCVGIVYLGLSDGILRFAYELPAGWSIQNLLWKCISLAGVVFFISSALVLCFYDAISYWLFHEISLYKICLLLLYTGTLMLLNYFFVSYYRSMNLVIPFTIQQIGVQFFSKIFIMTAIFIGVTTNTVLTINVAGMFIFLLFCMYIQQKDIFPKKWAGSFADLSDVIKFSLLSWPGGLLARISLFLIPFVLSQRMGAYEVGLYASTSIFVAVIVVLNTGFMTYWVSYVYKNAKAKQDLIIRVHNYMAICIFFVFSIIIIAQHILYFLIGSEYQMSRIFFSLVMSDVFFLALEATTQQGIVLEKKPHEGVLVSLITLVIQFVCAWYLAEYMGIVGAALATMIAAACRFLLSTWRGQKYYCSIEKWHKTLMAMLMILSLATSNWIFADEYWLELGMIFLIGSLFLWIFRRDVAAAVRLLYEYKDMRQRGNTI